MKQSIANFYGMPLCGLVAAFTFTTSLAGQDSSADTAYMAEQLEPYVVVVTRTPISIDDASPSVSCVSADDMEAHQDRRLVDVLKREPGIVLNTSGATGSLTSLFLRGTNSDHTGFFLDGCRLNAGFGNQYNLEFLASDNLQSAQVLRGASSVNYGSSGIGGVIDLQTRSGLGTAGSESFIEAEIGGNSTSRGAFSTTYADTDWAISVGGSVFTTDNERENDDFETLSLNARIDYQLTNTLSFELLSFITDSEKELAGPASSPEADDVADTESWLISPGVRSKRPFTLLRHVVLT